jgi:hypothetical protein
MPGFRQVCESHCRSRDSCPVCIENSVESGYERGAKQEFRHAMKVQVQTGEECNSVNDPGENRREEEESQQTQPNRRRPVKSAQSGVCVTKGEEGSGYKAYGQNAESQLSPQRPGVAAS